jgi:hypothetical protein
MDIEGYYYSVIPYFLYLKVKNEKKYLNNMIHLYGIIIGMLLTALVAVVGTFQMLKQLNDERETTQEGQ